MTTDLLTEFDELIAKALTGKPCGHDCLAFRTRLSSLLASACVVKGLEWKPWLTDDGRAIGLRAESVFGLPYLLRPVGHDGRCQWWLGRDFGDVRESEQAAKEAADKCNRERLKPALAPLGTERGAEQMPSTDAAELRLYRRMNDLAMHLFENSDITRPDQRWVVVDVDDDTCGTGATPFEAMWDAMGGEDEAAASMAGENMNHFTRDCLTSPILSKAAVEHRYRQAASGEVISLCLSHERLRMDLEGADGEIDRLIVAVRELLTACKAALDDGPHNASHGLNCGVVEMLRAAVAMAEPKSPTPPAPAPASEGEKRKPRPNCNIS